MWLKHILWNSMTLTSFVFTELANTMKYGGGVLYNLAFTEWRHWVSQNEVWGRGSYITEYATRCIKIKKQIIITVFIEPNFDVANLIYPRQQHTSLWSLWSITLLKNQLFARCSLPDKIQQPKRTTWEYKHVQRGKLLEKPPELCKTLRIFFGRRAIFFCQNYSSSHFRFS